MSKRIQTKNLTLGGVSTINNYLEWLKSKRGITTTKQAIHYQLQKTDNLDWCDWQGHKLIILNQKSQVYTPKESKTG